MMHHMSTPDLPLVTAVDGKYPHQSRDDVGLPFGLLTVFAHDAEAPARPPDARSVDKRDQTLEIRQLWLEGDKLAEYVAKDLAFIGVGRRTSIR